MIVFVSLVFVFGIFLENKIKSNLGKINLNNKTEVIEVKEIIDYRETAVVKRVLDGDTIELIDGRKVRYVGVNSPEMTDERPEILCFANMAKAENIRLVEGKMVEMEKDVSDKDKYDRLLRYIWIDGKMVNLALVEGGFAQTATYPPDVKYKDLFLKAQKTALKLICNKI